MAKQEKMQDRVITSVAKLHGDLRRSFQERVRQLASTPPSTVSEDQAWTGFLVQACEAELASEALDRQGKTLLRSILRDSRRLLTA